MSIGKKNFHAELENELKRAGLPKNPREIIGRMYRFECQHGSHHHILVGTITAIYISDEGGLNLHVTNTEIWGQKIRSIIRVANKWALFIYQDKLTEHQMSEMSEKDISRHIAERFFYGEFYLI